MGLKGGLGPGPGESYTGNCSGWRLTSGGFNCPIKFCSLGAEKHAILSFFYKIAPLRLNFRAGKSSYTKLNK
jgi:hypothetical protein